ncbi:NUDIX hydrolase [Patescibacteria group bacterium]|nr:NUDIX hydrolase [Patescibacteria group bacterium]
METCVRAFIFDEDDNVLLVRNASDQLWVLPGGHTEEGETIYEALEREIHEELGLDITIL